jgi:transposase-like protein
MYPQMQDRECVAERGSVGVADVEATLQLDHHSHVLDLSPAEYPGGIAMWGALPAVYNTSIAPDEFGVHVHARLKVGGKKSLDETFDLVRVQLPDLQGEQQFFTVNGDAAARYNIATILGVELTDLQCPSCHIVHSDNDFNLVHPHEHHICEACGTTWSSGAPTVSNPVMLLKKMCGDDQQYRTIIDPVGRTINQPQSRFPGGVQIWGSNPAIVWTSPKPEEGGLHFHAFKTRKIMPDVDETYGTVTLDGLFLDAEQVRYIMAQRMLEFLQGRIVALSCPHCCRPHFDRLQYSVTPHALHRCEHCDFDFNSPSETPLCVSNPVIAMLDRLQQAWHDVQER